MVKLTNLLEDIWNPTNTLGIPATYFSFLIEGKKPNQLIDIKGLSKDEVEKKIKLELLNMSETDNKEKERIKSEIEAGTDTDFNIYDDHASYKDNRHKDLAYFSPISLDKLDFI